MKRSDQSLPVRAHERGHVHVITPGDHYSPRTGSAVPTVVDGLVRGASTTSAPSSVVVARGTYPDRYGGVSVLEYPQASARRWDRYLDAASSRAGLPRHGARRAYAATVRDQGGWAPSYVLAHNAPQLVPLVDAARHVPVLYAHNQLLRTYGHRELARTLGPVHRIVCVSAFLADETATLLPPGLRDRVVVVHNGVDAPAEHGARAPRGDTLHVVFVGRTIPDKGADVVVDAVRRLARPDVRLTVVGSAGFDAAAPLTPHEKALRQRASGTPVPPAFTGFLPRGEVREILRTADVVVVPSRWAEPFALTALEGMSAGAAVVASDVGGIPEAVGSAGILVPPGDVVALADALAALADDESLLARAQEAGRAHAAAMSWSHARARLDRVLDGARAPSPRGTP
ncbi:glycosyltransferase family 4 protein [Oerskovia sp. Sa1BUA8]|uniref:Glycosyltransferase family 4 protein n=1 Tax=Oerskovia douganii TaxID=2762210 RepID=A0A9D5YXK1_9CELL|nr:glycosyltransferase family 4 protein [Oerskovia douganii]MBE7699683.1 glycosyltransferase family 4 protein [Oerskovia douganii]